MEQMINSEKENAMMQEDIREKNNRRNRLYRKVSSILSRVHNVDEGVNEVLRIVGESMEASRVYIFENKPNAPGFARNTYEWCADGMESQMEYFQNFSYEEFGFPKELKEGIVLCIGDVETTDYFRKEILQDLGIRAVLQYAICDSGRLGGFIGLDDRTRPRMDWKTGEEEQMLLSFVADLLSMYLIKERNLARLVESERKAIEASEIITALSRDFLNVFIINPVDGTITIEKLAGFLMEGFEKKTGVWYDYKDIYTRYVAERVHPQDRQMMMKNLSLENILEVLKTSEESVSTYRIMVQGEIHYYQYKYIRISGNRIIAGFKNVDDIVEREARAQREEMEKINNRLSTFLGGVNGGLRVSEYNSHYACRFVSPELAGMLGYTQEEFVELYRLGVKKLIHPDDFQTAFNALTSQIKDNSAAVCKYRIRAKDGSWLWVSEYSKLVTNSEGEQLVYSLVQNINEQELLNRQFKLERETYQEALTKDAFFHYTMDMTDGYIYEDIHSKNGNGLMCTYGVALPITYDQVTAILRRSGFRALDEFGEKAFYRREILKLAEDGVMQGEYHLYHQGKDYYIRALLLLRRNEEDDHIYATFIQHDETETKRKERAAIEHEEMQRKLIEEALTAAENANKAKTIFLNNMSHDIRTPMNAIIGFTSLAQSHIDDKDKVKDYLEKIQVSSDHLLSLINGVLDMSSIEAGKMKMEASGVSLASIMQDVKNIIQADIKRKQQVLVYDIGAIKDEWVICDKLRLSQVLINCLSNAVKFTPEGKTVELSLRQLPCSKEGYATYEFHIKDTGIGMSKEFMEHLYKPFVREQTSTISGVQGTGLGLCITKKIVDYMDGDIHVSSEKGKGTEFTITLSFEIAGGKQDKEVVADGLQNQTGQRLDGLKILLVEDNEINREIAMEILTEKGADIEIALDGAKAVQKVKEGDFYDVILMDVQMPIMDGYEATRIIRSLPDSVKAKIPIIAMTANAFEEDKKTALEAGMNDYVAKPIHFGELVKTINNFCAKYQKIVEKI